MRLLQLSLDYIGVSGFATRLALFRDVDKAIGLLQGALRDGDLLAPGAEPVVQRNDRSHKSTSCHLKLCLGANGVRFGEADATDLREAHGLGHHTLAVILVHGVVSDEDGKGLGDSTLCRLRCRVIGLGEEKLVVVTRRGQQCGECIFVFQDGCSALSGGGRKGWLICLGTPDRLFERKRAARSRCGRLHRPLRESCAAEEHNAPKRQRSSDERQRQGQHQPSPYRDMVKSG